jgi:Ca2+-binding RTX toxin-like protein
LVLIGTGDTVGRGNALNNTIQGNDGNNILDGLGGADVLVGGLGDDTYGVDNARDVVIEDTSGGNDTVQASITYSLGANLENLQLLGAQNINGFGNELNNTIIGNDGANRLDGFGGNDTFFGGLGNDTYVVDSDTDVVNETLATGGLDTVESSVTYSLGANLENLVLTGNDAIDGTGNELNNTITGNSGNNTLDGGAGIDTLSGLGGDDIYFVGAGDRVFEQAAAGVDLVYSTVTFSLGANVENLILQPGAGDINGTGNAGNNTIRGNEGNNRLDGGAGADLLIGEAGNDTYIVDSQDDVVVETSAAGGIDRVEASVTYTLGANQENLSLTGTNNINGFGNELNNTITGNSVSNIIDGGAGADAMSGGGGNDTYFVDNLGDTVTELVGGGTDTVVSSVTFLLNTPQTANIENVILIGTATLTSLATIWLTP